MCVVSMVMDHYRDKWSPLTQPSYPTITNREPAITDAEIREFRELLNRAREYDKRNNEPECEMESKKEAVRNLAKILGVDVSFIDNP